MNVTSVLMTAAAVPGAFSSSKGKSKSKFPVPSGTGNKKKKKKTADTDADTDTDETKAEEEYIGVVYRRHLIHVEDDFPLFGCSYYGQAVRSPDKYADHFAVAKKRWDEENGRATRESHELGLLAVLDMFGASVLEDSIVDIKKGPRSEVQAWADALEKQLIDENGGVLRNMDKKLNQTLNVLKGGKGTKWWESQVAFRNKKLTQFKAEMESFVKEERPSILKPGTMEQTSRVPYSYVNPKNGYRLGQQLSNFRKGHLWMGHPDKAEIRKWAGSLDKWSWKIDKSTDEEWKATHSANRKAIYAKKRELELSKLTGDEREKALKQHADIDRATANQKEDLATLRSIDGWEHATTSDLARAREEGVLERRDRIANKAATDAKKRELKLSKLTGKAREKAVHRYANFDRDNAKRKAEVEKYRIDHPGATHKAFFAAKKAAKEEAEKAKLAERAAAKAASKKPIVAQVPSVASDDENVVGSSSSDPLPVRKQPKQGPLHKRTTITTIEEFEPPAKRAKSDDDSVTVQE